MNSLKKQINSIMVSLLGEEGISVSNGSIDVLFSQ